MDSIKTFLSPKLTFDKKATILFDRTNPSENLMKRLDAYIRQGGTVIYLCTENAYLEQRTELLNYFNIKFNVLSEKTMDTDYVEVTGDAGVCENVFQLPWIPSIKSAGATPIVYGESDPQKIYLMKREIDKGAIYVVPFNKIFKTKCMGIGTSSRNSNMRQQQVRRLQENLVRQIIGNK